MPRVPLAERQVGSQSIGAPQVSTGTPIEALGGGAAAARVNLGPTADTLNTLFLEQRQKADELALLDAETRLGQGETSLLYAPENGLLNRKGKDAFSAQDDAQDGWTKLTSEIENGLTNERQKLTFRRVAANRSVDVNRTVQRHVAEQTKTYDAEQTKAFVETERNAAITSYTDPRRVADAIARQQAAITTHAERNGMSPEWLALAKSAAASNTVASVIDRMLATDQDILAKQFYDASKDLLTGDEAVQAAKAVEQGSVVGEAQRRSLVIVNQHERLTDALAEVDKITDPKVQDQTRARVKERFAERDAQKRLDYEATAETAYKAVLDTGKVPMSLQAKLKPSDLVSITSYARQLAKKQPVETDWGVYYALKLGASSTNTKEKQQFMDVNLIGFRDKLSDEEFKELTNAQSLLRKGEEAPELTGYRTVSQVVDGILPSLGLDPNTRLNKPNERKVEIFRREVDAQVRQWKSDNKKTTVPTDVVQKIVNDIVIARPEGSTLDLLAETKVGDVKTIDDVPLREQKKIRDAFFRRNVNPTTDQIVQLYRARLAMLPGSNE